MKTREELEHIIRKAQEGYYGSGETSISDIEYDELWDELKKRFPDSPLVSSVGTSRADGFDKIEHSIVMGSQNKANTAEDMDTFFQKNGRTLYVAQFKLDGSSVAMNYEHGKLVSAGTRGDGRVGDDITQNALKMKGVVKKLPDTTFTGTVRGEILLDRNDKERYFPEMKNCRNAAAGIMKHLDGTDCEKLTVRVYDAQYSDDGKTFGRQTKLQKWLGDQGFMVADWRTFDVSSGLSGADAIAMINEEFSDERNSARGYDIDGIVFKKDEIDMDDIRTEIRPKTQIALKPKYTLAETVIEDIEWSVKNGTVTPVAIVRPCEIDGSTVRRASLANISLMEDLGIEIGHRVLLTKAGLIIPKILKDLDTGKSAEGYLF